MALAIPNILSNVSVPLISSVDTGLMGRLSPAHVAAVGVSSMIFNMLYWNFGFLRMGTTGITAQAHGADDHAAIGNTLVRASLLGLTVGLLFILFKDVILSAGMGIMDVADDQVGMVTDYFQVRILAAPAALVLISLMGWFFGRQNAIYPMIITIAVNVVNIISSYYFVRYADMGIRGVALGTLVSNYSGLLLAIGFLLYRYRRDIKEIILAKALILKEYLGFLRVNGDIFIRTLCLTFVFTFFYRESSSAGEMILAANVILMQFVNWMSYGIDGFAYASESLVGKYHGRKDKNNLASIIRLSFVWGGAVALLYTVAYGIFGKNILGLFTTDADLYAFTQPLLYWVVITPIVGFASYIWDGIYVGLVASKSMRNSMMLALLIFLALYFGLPPMAQLGHLWIALLGFLLARAVFQYILFKRHGADLK